MDLLLRINQEKKITLITVLHHLQYVRDHFDRVIALKEGTVCFDASTRSLNDRHLQDIYTFDEEEEMECVTA